MYTLVIVLSEAAPLTFIYWNLGAAIEECNKQRKTQYDAYIERTSTGDRVY